jgi:hypothetical protein
MNEPDNKDLAWTVRQCSDGWYFYTDQGVAIGPFDEKEHADQSLDDYEASYYD